MKGQFCCKPLNPAVTLKSLALMPEPMIISLSLTPWKNCLPASGRCCVGLLALSRRCCSGESCQLNPRAFEVSYRDQPITLSPKEFNLLELFMRNPQRVFDNATLLERVWGFDENPRRKKPSETHIKRLRQKLKRGRSNLCD